jgi:hypothetical protein
MRIENDDNRRQAQGVESLCGEFRVNSGRVIRCLVISSVTCIASLLVIVLGFVVAFPEPAINKNEKGGRNLFHNAPAAALCAAPSWAAPMPSVSLVAYGEVIREMLA